MSGSLPAAVVGHPVGGSATAYPRWACRALLCFWAQSVQRVCPWFTLFGQSLHSPSFLRRSRFSRVCTRESSRFSSSVSWGLVGSVVDLRLAEPVRALRPGLAALRFRGRVLPALAGLGRMKVNSKVPPIARVCGGTAGHNHLVGNSHGLSPRVRGNLQQRSRQHQSRGSIPACAGEPDSAAPSSCWSRVYPRVCGGTTLNNDLVWTVAGLSPRVRGNLEEDAQDQALLGSIPACAGEPGYS